MVRRLRTAPVESIQSQRKCFPRNPGVRGTVRHIGNGEWGTKCGQSRAHSRDSASLPGWQTEGVGASGVPCPLLWCFSPPPWPRYHHVPSFCLWIWAFRASRGERSNRADLVLLSPRHSVLTLPGPDAGPVKGRLWAVFLGSQSLFFVILCTFKGSH